MATKKRKGGKFFGGKRFHWHPGVEIKGELQAVRPHWCRYTPFGEARIFEPQGEGGLWMVVHPRFDEVRLLKNQHKVHRLIDRLRGIF
mgnify:CR=1